MAINITGVSDHPHWWKRESPYFRVSSIWLFTYRCSVLQSWSTGFQMSVYIFQHLIVCQTALCIIVFSFIDTLIVRCPISSWLTPSSVDSSGLRSNKLFAQWPQHHNNPIESVYSLSFNHFQSCMLEQLQWKPTDIDQFLVDTFLIITCCAAPYKCQLVHRGWNRSSILWLFLFVQ